MHKNQNICRPTAHQRNALVAGRGRIFVAGGPRVTWWCPPTTSGPPQPLQTPAAAATTCRHLRQPPHLLLRRRRHWSLANGIVLVLTCSTEARKEAFSVHLMSTVKAESTAEATEERGRTCRGVVASIRPAPATSHNHNQGQSTMRGSSDLPKNNDRECHHCKRPT